MAATLAILLVLNGFGGSFVEQIRDLSLRCFGDLGTLSGDGLGVAGREAAKALMGIVGPITLFACIAAVAAGFAEAGYHPKLELASPRWNRLDPTSRLMQMFSPKAGLASTALALARVGVVAIVGYLVIDREFDRLERLSTMRLADGVLLVAAVMSKLALWSTLALAVMTGIDYGTAWFRHEKSIRMSLDEMKREHQQQEGDPRVKARLRQKARELVKKGLRKQVLESDVIIANPTHIAIALRYRPAQGAPVVMAKGFDDIALYMRKIAEEAGIPVVENRPLARALSAVKSGKVIPVELYATVAEVLAFVYRLKNRGRRA
jgi:flagellar biosynthetic protein FlhB